LYLIGYGTVRFFIEFFRKPDAQVGGVLMGLSMRQAEKAGICWRWWEEVAVLVGLAYSVASLRWMR